MKMRKCVFVAAMSFICMSPDARSATQALRLGHEEHDLAPTVVAMGAPTVNGKTFEWRYQMRNDSAQDIWICASMGMHCCEAHLAEDNETFLIQRRLDVHPEILMGTQPSAIYVRLRGGETRTEVMSFKLPIQPQYIYRMSRQRKESLEYAARVALEIGYYVGDMPAMVFDVLHKGETDPKVYPRGVSPEEYGPSRWLGGTQGFLKFNEGRGAKSEWISVGHSWGSLKGERILRLTADGLHIPYLEQDRHVWRPDLGKCTSIEMKFKTPSLEFFFPYAHEQSLLSPTERQYLQALDTLVTEDSAILKAFTDEVQGGLRDAFVWEHGVAELTGYCDDERLMSVMVYNGSELVTSEGQVFHYLYPELYTLRRVTPQIESLTLRVQCAANLQDLWHRFRLYQRVSAPDSGTAQREDQKDYPRPRKWCDTTSRAYQPLGKGLLRPYKCPSVPKGKCHYAMNPNCTYNSPADTVLLFETKAGWNLHGGPELFTFDNHDPKGGLVLLNDGTVKFIRTEEELKQLRWK